MLLACCVNCALMLAPAAPEKELPAVVSVQLRIRGEAGNLVFLLKDDALLAGIEGEKLKPIDIPMGTYERLRRQAAGIVGAIAAGTYRVKKSVHQTCDLEIRTNRGVTEYRLRDVSELPDAPKPLLAMVGGLSGLAKW